MPAIHQRRWTAREVRNLIAANPLHTPRYELVDGELLVTPSPGPPHQRAVRGLVLALDRYLQRAPVGELLFSPADVELERETIVQPDLFIVPVHESTRLNRSGFPTFQLLLAIEIVSPSSSRIDRVAKRALYQRHVPDYWIFDLDARAVEWWRMAEQHPDVVTKQLRWQPQGAGCAFELDLPEFFASFLHPNAAPR